MKWINKPRGPCVVPGNSIEGVFREASTERASNIATSLFSIMLKKGKSWQRTGVKLLFQRRDHTYDSHFKTPLVGASSRFLVDGLFFAPSFLAGFLETFPPPPLFPSPISNSSSRPSRPKLSSLSSSSSLPDGSASCSWSGWSSSSSSSVLRFFPVLSLFFLFCFVLSAVCFFFWGPSLTASGEDSSDETRGGSWWDSAEPQMRDWLDYRLEPHIKYVIHICKV